MGSGGGGSSSGRVDFPDYMKTWHGIALDNSGVDVLTTSITDVMNAALGVSPFAAVVAYDPDTELAAMLAAPDLITTEIAASISDAAVDNAVTEFSEDLGNRLTAEVLPRFEAGMRDINAVVSSAFVIGRGIIEDGQTRQVAKYSADLHFKVINIRLEYRRVVAQLIIEANRMKIVAKKEEADGNLRIEEADATWDLNVFKYGGNLLASISGAAVSEPIDKRSTAHSVIGGALTGAAAGALYGAMEGAAVASLPGAIIGGLLGAGAGLL